MRECPSCHLANPDEAPRCDCGQELSPTMHTQNYSLIAERPIASDRTILQLKSITVAGLKFLAPPLVAFALITGLIVYIFISIEGGWPPGYFLYPLVVAAVAIIVPGFANAVWYLSSKSKWSWPTTLIRYFLLQCSWLLVLVMLVIARSGKN